MATMKNLHIPFPVQWYQKLRELADSSHTTATELVRSATIEFIKAQEKKDIAMAITQFASTYGGTEFDLDKDLEQAGIELLENT